MKLRDKIEHRIACYIYGKHHVIPLREKGMTDLTVETDELGVTHVEAHTTRGEDFLNAFVCEGLQVIDSDRIAVPVGVRERFLKSARAMNVSVDG